MEGGREGKEGERKDGGREGKEGEREGRGREDGKERGEGEEGKEGSPGGAAPTNHCVPLLQRTLLFCPPTMPHLPSHPHPLESS